MNCPSVSVVMPVRNAMPYLDKAIQSILAQTYRDFELIIGDDSSTDDSRARIHAWARRDPRIRVLESDTPMGPAGSSNWVAQAATATLVARMDGDDIAHPDRLRRQIAVLKARPDAVLVGSMFEAIDEKGRMTRGRNRGVLLRRDGLPGIAHSSILYRAATFRDVGGYCAEHDFYEDADLYMRMARRGAVLILPEPYIRYRFSANSSRQTADQARVVQALERYVQWHARHFGAGKGKPASSKISPDVIYMLGSHRLWAGHRPGMLGRILSDAELSWNRQSALLLGWGVWSTLSPGTLRACLRLRARLRDWAAGRTIHDGEIYCWIPPTDCQTFTVIPADA